MIDLLKFKTLPRSLTSYDVLKTAAVVLMIIDHIGNFFYPDEMWFRVIGRMCVPMWFFLIGYANTREIPFSYIAGGAVLALAGLAMTGSALPLNIILTLMAYRLMIDHIMVRALKDYEAFFGVSLIVFIISYPSMFALEYGTMTLFFVMLGYIIRHREGIEIKPWVFWLFVLGPATAFSLMQGMLLPTITGTQFFVMLAGVLGVVFMLTNFRPIVFENFGGAKASVFQFLGRRTMEVYVLHFLVFAVISMLIADGVLTLFGHEVLSLENMQLFFS